jgi:cytoskeletal protein CcmA (bactofilin family)
MSEQGREDQHWRRIPRRGSLEVLQCASVVQSYSLLAAKLVDELTLVEMVRQARQSFIAFVRRKNGVLADQAGGLAFGGKGNGGGKMADQADDLGILTKLARRRSGAHEPSKITDGPRPGAESVPGPPLPPIPNFLRADAQPAQVSSLPRPKPDLAVAPGDNDVEPRKLIVGQGTSLSGEINSSDRIVVEGSVQVNLQNCQHMTITETGSFGGNAAVDEAEVHGRFEGDLRVRRRLLIRAHGHVSGRISYGEIEIEAGGKISGMIQAASNR